jgi:hypothetical protein
VVSNAFIPNTPVNIMKSQGLFSAIRNRISFEILDSNTVMNELGNMIHHSHFDFALFSWVGFLAMFIIYNTDDSFQTSSSKMRQFQEFSVVERRVNLCIWVLIYILFRNVDIVL